MRNKMIYFFANCHAEGNAAMSEELGGKGANLAEMTNLGVLVPPGFTITTDVCAAYYNSDGKWPEGLKGQVQKNIAKLEEVMDTRLGDPQKPLLVSVRSGAAKSMPGMMDTVLNLGLNDKVVKGLIDKTGSERFAYDAYRRFIDMFGDVVMGCSHKPFEKAIEELKKQADAKLDTDLDAEALKELVKQYKEIFKKLVKKTVPTGTRQATSISNQRCIRIMEHSTGSPLSPDSQNNRFERNSSECSGDGVRQYG